ncbi:hypothetical protein M3Y98_00349900 [Aphelenchoides besseyi]|nr:hypothetical protein M3Y98_00349900 [Aphelenchoides besseyi]KAI6201613.1 hypothetical protein M3Y96_00860900 [Aphelenchoides besseyi]
MDAGNLEADVSERSSSSRSLPLYRRDVHAHYDRIVFSQLNLSLIRDYHQSNCYKFRFLVKCDGEQQIQRSSADLVDFDQNLHDCIFTRRYSRLPMLSSELFAISDNLSRKQRILQQGEIRNLVDVFMRRFTAILQRDEIKIGCTHVLNFVELNNKGQHDGNPVPIPAFIERTYGTEDSYINKIRYALRNERNFTHGRVFGVDLEKHLDSCVEAIPCILLDATRFIENNLALGVYRVSGSMTQMNSLKEIYDNKRSDNYEFERVANIDVHVIACLLKFYFRSIPNRLFGRFSSSCINSAMQSSAIEQQIRNARELSRRLTSANFRTAAFLMRHLALISEQHALTGMDHANLSLVWTPNLFRIKHPRDQVSSLSTQNLLIQVFIKWYKEIFYDLVNINESSFLSTNGNSLTHSNEINGFTHDRSESPECKSPKYLHKRVRSEEPIGNTMIGQVKRNIKTLGSNIKSSFRNLVRLNNRGTNSPTSSNSCVEFFSQTPRNFNEHSNASLNIPLSPGIERLDSCGYSNYSGADSEYTAMFSFHNFNAPKAELDAISVDSIPFDASRYDNIEKRN